MRVYFERKLADFRGRDIIDPDGNPMTLRVAACTALATVAPGDERATLAEKMERDGLAGRIWRGEATDLPVEQLATIKDRLNKVFPSAAVVGAGVRALEDAAEPPAERAVLPLGPQLVPDGPPDGLAP